MIDDLAQVVSALNAVLNLAKDFTDLVFDGVWASGLVFEAFQMRKEFVVYERDQVIARLRFVVIDLTDRKWLFDGEGKGRMRSHAKTQRRKGGKMGKTMGQAIYFFPLNPWPVHPEVVGGLAGLSLRYGPQSAHRN